VSESAATLLQRLLDSSVLRREDWDALPKWLRERLEGIADAGRLVDQLLMQGLLTGYQGGRVRAGRLDGLILGKYRVLDRVGAGNSGVIFKAEHLETRRSAAVKVLVPACHRDGQKLLRFDAERQTVAQLHHPNIVAALDVGEAATSDPDSPLLYYYAMEYVEGPDLERLVRDKGPLSEAQVCDVAVQVAAALAEAHKHSLVHRDVNPSNVLLTAEGQAKLLDFGQVRQARTRMTEPGTGLGGLEYTAPEQLKDAGAVDVRADIFGLGATLFWCLTGKPPFVRGKDLVQDVAARLTKPPPPVRSARPEVSPALEALIATMTALDPADRFPTPDAVIEAFQVLRGGAAPAAAAEEALVAERPATGCVLLVSADRELRAACRAALAEGGLDCHEAADARAALASAHVNVPNLVLLDAALPDKAAGQVLAALRRKPPHPHMKVLMLTASAAPETFPQILAEGADGYVARSADAAELRTRVRSTLVLQQAQSRVRLAQVAAQADSPPESPAAAADEGADPAARAGGWFKPLGWLFGRRAPAKAR
jgi:CheY-like chemotaxis protein